MSVLSGALPERSPPPPLLYGSQGTPSGAEELEPSVLPPNGCPFLHRPRFCDTGQVQR